MVVIVNQCLSFVQCLLFAFCSKTESSLSSKITKIKPWANWNAMQSEDRYLGGVCSCGRRAPATSGKMSRRSDICKSPSHSPRPHRDCHRRQRASACEPSSTPPPRQHVADHLRLLQTMILPLRNICSGTELTTINCRTQQCGTSTSLESWARKTSWWRKLGDEEVLHAHKLATDRPFFPLCYLRLPAQCFFTPLYFFLYFLVFVFCTILFK